MGFSAVGPVAGSFATGWQAGIGGSVAAGSLFAFLQSAAMGGAAIGLFTGIGAVGVLFASVGVGASVDTRKKFAETGGIIIENSAKAGEAIKDGAIQVGGAVAVGAIQMGKTVGGWWGKMKGKMKGE